LIFLYVGAKFMPFQKLPPYLGGITATPKEAFFIATRQYSK
jgi:hypothetical protein